MLDWGALLTWNLALLYGGMGMVAIGAVMAVSEIKDIVRRRSRRREGVPA